VLVARIDPSELTKLQVQTNDFATWNEGHATIPSELRLCSLVEERKTEEFPIGSKIEIVVGYSSPTDQYFTGTDPVKLLSFAHPTTVAT
jgi:hypothetical protein